MKIGFISRAFPAQPETSVHGMYKRMGMFIDALKQIGEMDMLYYVNPDLKLNTDYIAHMKERLSRYWNTELQLDLCKLASPKTSTGRWREYVSPALNISSHPPYQQTAQPEQIDAFLRLLDRKPDILFVHRLASMTPVLLSGGELPPVYFDLDDIEHVAFARSIKQPPWWPGKRLYYLRLPILRRLEAKAIRISRTTFVCSEHDRRYLSKRFGTSAVSVIPNAVEIPAEQEITGKPKILFLGTFAYPPNVVAADYLIRTIWPGILARVPDARLLIAGAYPERIGTFADRPPGVEFLGFVHDLERMYKEIKIVCCPILSGGGTRIKILEAAAYGKPIVSTTIGAEGIDLKDGEEILLRDTPHSFGEACVRLLKDRNLAMRIGRNARSSVSLQYDRNAVIETIRMHFNHFTKIPSMRQKVISGAP